MKMNHLGLGVATGALLAATACSTEQASKEDYRQTLEALAAPYASCVIQNVIEDSTPPPAYLDNLPRQAVGFTVLTTVTSAAKEARKHYDTDDRFIWNDNVQGHLLFPGQNDKKYKGVPVAGQITNNLYSDNPREIYLYPQKRYSDGTKINVSVETSVWGNGSEKLADTNKPAKTTETSCGSLVLKAGVWHQAR
jgi:hypothetical protein